MEQDIFSERFLLERPLLAAIRRPDRPVLLIDEIDRADEEFEAFLLELLSDFQVSIPELGTIRAASIPRVVLTSNSTRELSDALRRRCLYHYVDYPDVERETRIILARVPGIATALALQIARLVEERAQGGAAQGPRRGRDAGLGRRSGRPRRREPARRAGDGARDPALPPEDPGGPRALHARGVGAPAGKGRVMGSPAPEAGDFTAAGAHMARRLSAFMHTLRDNAFAVGLKEGEDAAVVLASPLAARRDSLRSALKALVCARRSDWLRFDAVFDAFWLGHGVRRVVPLVSDARGAKRPELRQLSGPNAEQQTRSGLAEQVDPGDDSEADGDASPAQAHGRRVAGGASRRDRLPQDPRPCGHRRGACAC